MKINKSTTLKDLALYVSSELTKKNISCVLTGGAVVSIYTENKYQSYDLDFVSEHSHKNITDALYEIGFKKDGRSFVHPDTEFYVEFPPGPLSIGDEVIKEEGKIESDGKVLKLLSPTQCVMDRLVGYYHWNDQQNLEQALLVAKEQPINLEKIKKWSQTEGELPKFEKFLEKLKL